MEKVVGFIGLGHLGTAVLKGIQKSSLGSTSKLLGYHYDAAQVSALKERTQIEVHSNLAAFIADCEVVFIAVKPDDVVNLTKLLDQLDLTNKIFVSFVSGQKISDWTRQFHQPISFAVAIPNVNAEFQLSVTCVNFAATITKDQKQLVCDLLDSFGRTYELSEELFAKFTVLGGSAPAWIFKLTAALQQAITNQGFPAPMAAEMALQVVYGSAVSLHNTRVDPQAMVDAVCTPSGITIAGINYLNRHHFDELIAESLTQAILRNAELAEAPND